MCTPSGGTTPTPRFRAFARTDQQLKHEPTHAPAAAQLHTAVLLQAAERAATGCTVARGWPRARDGHGALMWSESPDPAYMVNHQRHGGIVWDMRQTRHNKQRQWRRRGGGNNRGRHLLQPATPCGNLQQSAAACNCPLPPATARSRPQPPRQRMQPQQQRQPRRRH